MYIIGYGFGNKKYISTICKNSEIMYLNGREFMESEISLKSAFCF